MIHPHLIVPVVCAADGTALSLLLLFLLKRQSGNPREWTAGVLLAVSSLVIFFSSLVSSVALAAGLSRQSSVSLENSRITFSMVAFIPLEILLSWKWSSIFKEGSPISDRYFRSALLTTSLIVGVLWLAPFLQLNRDYLAKILIFNILVILMIGFRDLMRQTLSVQLRLCMEITRAFYAVGLILGLILSTPESTPSLIYTVFGAIQQLSVLAGILGSFIFIAQFHLADVFIKWSVRILVLSTVAMGATIGLTVLSGNGDRTYFALAETAILFVLLTVVLTVTPAIEKLAAHWLLQQVDLKEGLERISVGILAFDSEPQLLSSIDREVLNCLPLTLVRTISCDAFPESILDKLRSFGDVVEAYRTRLGPFADGLGNPEMLVPVMVEAEMRYVMVISAGSVRRTLLGSEIQFLRAVARQLGLRIHQLEREAVSRQQALRESLLRNQLTEAELRALRAQVNPHFLFNSLNTISELILTSPVNAERMTLRLASIFRHVLAQANRQFMTLREEFDFLRNYLYIEQERFGDRLNVSLTLDPALMHQYVPTLLLQPIVENALKHGLAPKEGEGHLQISATQHGGSIKLLICDDGVGYLCTRPFRTGGQLNPRPLGVGLVNTASRLRTIYGDQATIRIDSAPMEGCRVSISYPLKASRYALTHH